jgi:hypothetical protein
MSPYPFDSINWDGRKSKLNPRYHCTNMGMTTWT